MSKQIYKYELRLTDEFVLDLPIYAQILLLQLQDNIPCLWVLLDPDDDSIKRTFKFYSTGQSIDDNLWINYIGSIQFPADMIKTNVQHLFEIVNIAVKSDAH